jgi:hypothetical protein
MATVTQGALLAAGEKDVAIVAADEPQDAALMFERLARDPNASVDKIERLMALWERGEARKAEAAFNAAMSAAQSEMRSVAVDSDNPQTRSRYASYQALDRALRPIYTKHGFGLSFDTGDGAPESFVRMLCYVTHGGGHSRTYKADMPADGKGAKGGDVMTKTHAVGAAMSYGMRYLLKMVFNIAVGEDDKDGNVPKEKPEPKAPVGFDDWWTDFQAVADNGIQALDAAWSAANKGGKTKAYLAYARDTKGDALNKLKTKAARVAAS